MKHGFLNSPKVKNEPLYPGPSATQATDAAVQPAATKSTEKNVVTKLTYEKVENTGIPDDYKPSNFALTETDISRTDHLEDRIVLATIPSMVIDGPLDPDGHSKWIVLSATKRKVINLPGYPQPVPKPVGPPAYVVKSTPNMGLGLFATRDIRVGELVFAERPLLVSPRNLASLGIRLPKEYDTMTSQMVTMFEWEKHFEVAVGRMTPENQATFRSLANNHKEDGSGPLLGIIRTNGYCIENLYDGDKRHPEDATSYTAVANVGSRINHSCMPNITHKFTLPSFSFQFTAKRDIKAGEQVFFAYCGIAQSAAKRQAELAPYGIECNCPSCANATPETDKFHEEYEQRMEDYIWKITQWVAAPHIDESALDPVLRFREMLIQEGLHVAGQYTSLLLMVQQFYAKLGLDDKAKTYLEEYERYKLVVH